MTARNYKKFKAIFCLLKYVMIIENIIRHLVKKVLFQQKLRQKSLMEQPWSMVSIEEGKDASRLLVNGVKAECRFHRIYFENPKGNLTICHSR